MSRKSIMIMAGGTGGHVYPALAVAKYLLGKELNVQWLGTEQGLEYRIVPENGIPLHIIRISGVRGKGIMRLFLSPFLILRALIESIMILRRESPQVVLGMGGFVSGPGGLAAWLLRIPLCLHEQNAIAGMTNRLLKPFAKIVMQAFPHTFNAKGNLFTTGNPVRHDILSVRPPEERMTQNRQDVKILIIGGSLGALKLNQVVPAALSQLDDRLTVNVRHQTGQQHLQMTLQEYEKHGVEADITDFIDDMAAAYSWADLVVCRAGAMTIAELAAVGVGSILVPFPYAVDDHQAANARYLSDSGCAVLIRESELTPESLAGALKEMCRNHEHLISMAMICRELAKPRATEDVAMHCLEVARA